MSDGNSAQTPSLASMRTQRAAEAITRREFKWAANAGQGTINLVRAGESSPVFIQANN